MVQSTRKPAEITFVESVGGHGPWHARAEVRAAAFVGLPLALAGGLGTAAVARFHLHGVDGFLPAAWPALALVIAVAQCSVVSFQISRQARSASLTDIPFVVGLFLVSPMAFIGTRMLGAVLAQVVGRKQFREPVKLMFNLVTGFAEVAGGVLVFLLLSGGHHPDSAWSWLAALAGAVTANIISGLAVALLISRLERRLSGAALWNVVVSCAVQAAATGCLGLVAAVGLLTNRLIALPLLIVAVVIAVGYRAYARLADQHQSLERLYRFGRVVSAHADSEEILRGMLEEICELLVAEAAALTFFDDDGRPETEAWLRRGHDLERRTPRFLTPRAEWLTDRVCHQHQSVRITRDPRDLAARHWLDSAGVGEAMIAPLMGEGGLLAVVTVVDRIGAARGFDRDDLRLFETMANHAAIALRHGQLMRRLRHDSMHDALTGVGNRSFLNLEIDRLLDEMRSSGPPFALAMLDVDAFKEVNETLGHHQGDRLLELLAARLTEAVGSRGLVTRFGGDEFAILLPDCRSDTSAIRVGRALLDAASEPIEIEGTPVDIGASVGIARAPEHARTREQLVKRAEVAMYVAKQAGREVAVFNESYDTSSPNRLALVAAMRSAISEGTLDVHVQPQIEVTTGDVVAVEALVRWTDPMHGSVPPDEFIPLAERTGLIRPLTEVVLERAISACAQWQRDCPGVAVAVNLSARSLYDDAIDEQLGRLLSQYRLAAHLVTLELTESSVMADPGQTLGLLQRLRRRGVRLSIDDFGTGYSSLAYLRRLPVQEVKVDRSFVQRMSDEREDAAIVQSIIQLARTLDLAVVAEGVENQEAFDLLRQLGCDVAQGFHLARPMPIAAWPDWMRTWRRRTGIGHRLAVVREG